jgi:hypothetical protein
MKTSIELYNPGADDGIDIDTGDHGGLIRGTLWVFKKDRFLVNKIDPPPPNAELLFEDYVVCWLWFEIDSETGKLVAQHQITQPGQKHPKREKMPNPDPRDWPLYDGKPSDPMHDTRYIHFTSSNGEPVTFTTFSAYGRIGCDALQRAIRSVRRFSPRATPIVRPIVGEWSHRKYGTVKGPKFEPVRWLGRNAAASLGGIDDDDAVHKVGVRGDLHDEIPF